MIEQLFGSKTRVKLLYLFYSNPNRAFYVREITRKIDEQINSVRRELANLLSIGIVSSENNNNRLYYEVNQKYEYFVPLASIFGDSVVGDVSVAQTTSGGVEVNPIKSIGNIEIAIYTGQFTRDESSGIDLLIVGDLNTSKLANYIEELEKKEGKAIRYSVMPLSEFVYRRQVNDRFLSNVLLAKKQILIDKQQLLEKLHSTKKEE